MVFHSSCMHYWIIGLLDYWAIGLLDYWIIGLLAAAVHRSDDKYLIILSYYYHTIIIHKKYMGTKGKSVLYTCTIYRVSTEYLQSSEYRVQSPCSPSSQISRAKREKNNQRLTINLITPPLSPFSIHACHTPFVTWPELVLGQVSGVSGITVSPFHSITVSYIHVWCIKQVM